MKRLPLYLLILTFLPVSVAAQNIRVTNPSAGIAWGRGTSHEITWTRTGTMDANVRIILLRADGTQVGRIVNTTPNDGSYTWEIPADTEPGSYKIRVVTVDGAVRDTSDNFSILLVATFSSVPNPEPVPGAACDFSIESITFADGANLSYGAAYPRVGDLTGVFLVNALWNGNPPPGSGCGFSIEVKNVMTNQVISGANNPRSFNQSNVGGSNRARISVPFTIAAEDIYRSIRNRVIPLEFKLVKGRPDCDGNSANDRHSEDMRILNIPTESNFVVEVTPGSLSVSKSPCVGAVYRDMDDIQFSIRFRVKNLSRTDSGAPAAPVNNVKYTYHIDIPGTGGEPNHTRLEAEGTFPVVSSETWTEKSVSGSFRWSKNWWAPMYFIAVIDPDEGFFDSNRSNNRIQFEFTLPAYH
jgi:Kre9/KNH-like N-terminal Ig-like domain